MPLRAQNAVKRRIHLVLTLRLARYRTTEANVHSIRMYRRAGMSTDAHTAFAACKSTIFLISIAMFEI